MAAGAGKVYIADSANEVIRVLVPTRPRALRHPF